MRHQLFAGAALLAVMTSTSAFAQSTGSIDFEDGGEEIIVTGTRETDVGGIEVPDEPKARVEIQRELLLRQTPGQTVNDILNLVPGATFTNNDPFGSLGGNFSIRGFDSDRISQTVDGVPLNDSGNYAVYTNQQFDPEIVESVTVTLGSTDVDSPTASAVGGTINIRTLEPSDTIGALVSASYGDVVARGDPGSRPFHRVFGLFQTGDLTGFGTKAWVSASKATNDSTYSNYGGVDKQQYNAKIWQDIGSNGDFVAISGHYNQNRNNFNGSPVSNLVFTGEPEDRFYDILYPCNTDTPQTGVADTPNGCGNEFERRYNPSNTGNVRINSRFSLTDRLVLTVDPSYQYVKANGGGTVIGFESPTARTLGGAPIYGFIGNRYALGVDLNGDGDLLDQVRLISPSQTQTRRYGVIANLAYQLDDFNRVRLSYTFDRARHRQTGELGFIDLGGEPFDVFPVNDPIADADGNIVQKRNRKSFATLHQIAGEYRGEFFDSRLEILAGGRLPFFRRDLDQRCFTTTAGGFVDCLDESDNAAYAAANPGFAPPQERELNYDRFLPTVGVTFNLTPEASIFAGYAKNISVPGTDDLYNSLFFPADSAAGQPDPEISDSGEVGARFRSGIIQAQLTGWYTRYDNRLASAYDPETDTTITRNLGRVEKYGIDGSISVQPIPELLIYVFGSYIDSEIEDDVLGGRCTAANVTAGTNGCTVVGNQFFFPTGGKRESGAPEYTAGARVQASLGPFDIGAQIKRTGDRFLNDINTVTLPGYTVADLDIRYSLADYGLEETYFQLNVSNLFDEVYIGSASTGLTTGSTFANIGPPRAIIGSIIVGF